MKNTQDELCVTAIRMLSVDQVEQANSGHPGLPLGLAPAAYALFSRVLRHNPKDPNWANRDRFILSAGHGSALIYSLLHLYGYDLSIDDLRLFRQLGSLTPGHPEYHHTQGVEMTTGPLGQGISSAVGMALAEAMLSARLEAAGEFELIDHHTFVFASDGDLMEGISHEASSLAGHLGLNKLIVLFDSNDITISGAASLSCSDNALGRFASYGWNTILVEDAQDIDALEAAFLSAKQNTNGPTLIELRSVIGYGAPTKAGKSIVHGAALGPVEMAGTREFFGWSYDPFEIPAEVYTHIHESVAKYSAEQEAWQKRFTASSDAVKELIYPQIPTASRISESLETFTADQSLATRITSKKVLTQLHASIPSLVGGSADLAESTGTNLDLLAITAGDYLGREIHFGIREHAMGAILNGIALHGSFVPFGSTFLVFSDYVRPSVRLSAIMGLGVVYVFTHDSIAVGEDGPTHEPVEHLAALRAIPGLRVMRPADGNETNAAWSVAIGDASMPSALIFSRQNLPTVTEHKDPSWVTEVGAQVVYDPATPRAVVFATGSEVSLALSAVAHLEKTTGISARVVSVLWRERFFEAMGSKLELFTMGLPTIVVEAGISMGWERLVSSPKDIVCMNSYGASGKGPQVQAHFGFSPEIVAQRISDCLVRNEPLDSLANDSDETGRDLALENSLILACVNAAKACFGQIGRGDRKGADHLAVEAMRLTLSKSPVSIEVVIGEGEKDQAPMLYRGERLGNIHGRQYEIAVDPLEGTNYVAKGQPGAVSVIAAAPKGGFTFLPGFYMDKIVVGAKAKGALTLDASIEDNISSLAKALDKQVEELEIVVLEKPRHKEMIAKVRALGAKVREVPDGDVMACFEVLVGNLDALFGIGGAPEGVIMAAMAMALGGEFFGRLAPQSVAEAQVIASTDSSVIDKIFDQDDLVTQEPVVAITSVTGAGVLGPVIRKDGSLYISTALIRNGNYSVISQFA